MSTDICMISPKYIHVPSGYKKLKRIAILICLSMLGSKQYLQNLHAQNIDSSRFINWQSAGANIPESVEYNDLIISADQISTSAEDNDQLMSSVIEGLNNKNTRIVLPAGDIILSKSIRLPSNMILKGQGSNATKLIFTDDMFDNAIDLSGIVDYANKILVENAGDKGTHELTLNIDHNLEVDDWVWIRFNDQELIHSSWAEYTAGQVVQVTAINGNQIIIDQSLLHNYDDYDDVHLLVMRPVVNTGVECLSIDNTVHNNTGNHTANINIRHGVHCWVKGVASDNGNFAHVSIRTSAYVTVKDRYFQNAHNYGGGGNGYGIVLQFTTNKSLIENNILRHLRHAILLQAGANSNVMSFNYSREPFKIDWFATDYTGDIVFHGNYPYCNLVENNICQNIFIDSSHGLNGPNNTFLRNRVEGYGLIITETKSVGQNILANEIVGVSSSMAQNHYLKETLNVLSLMNMHKDGLVSMFDTDDIPSSYYYNNQTNKAPSTHGLIGYPNQPNAYHIPAYTRYNNTEELTVCSAPLVPVEHGFSVQVNIDQHTIQPSLEGIDVQMVGIDQNTQDILVRSSSDALGKITFTGLTEGMYRVIFDPENFNDNGALAGYYSNDLENIGDSHQAYSIDFFYIPEDADLLNVNFSNSDQVLAIDFDHGFRAQYASENSSVHLSWNRPTQKQVDKVTLFKSDDLGLWSIILESNELELSSYHDSELYLDNEYYYQVCFEKNSEETLCSDVISIKHLPTALKPSVLQNPVANWLKIKNTKQGSVYEIYNQANQKLTSTVADEQLTSIDLTRLIPGIYYLRYVEQSGPEVIKFVKI